MNGADPHDPRRPRAGSPGWERHLDLHLATRLARDVRVIPSRLGDRIRKRCDAFSTRMRMFSQHLIDRVAPADRVGDAVPIVHTGWWRPGPGPGVEATVASPRPATPSPPVPPVARVEAAAAVPPPEFGGAWAPSAPSSNDPPTRVAMAPGSDPNPSGLPPALPAEAANVADPQERGASPIHSQTGVTFRVPPGRPRPAGRDTGAYPPVVEDLAPAFHQMSAVPRPTPPSPAPTPRPAHQGDREDIGKPPARPTTPIGPGTAEVPDVRPVSAALSRAGLTDRVTGAEPEPSLLHASRPLPGDVGHPASALQPPPPGTRDIEPASGDPRSRHAGKTQAHAASWPGDTDDEPDRSLPIDPPRTHQPPIRTQPASPTIDLVTPSGTIVHDARIPPATLPHPASAGIPGSSQQRTPDQARPMVVDAGARAAGNAIRTSAHPPSPSSPHSDHATPDDREVPRHAPCPPIDIDRLAGQVERKIRQRLAVDAERRGEWA